jgi:glycosyltransferase involved in cell wall biosynthesis
MKYILSTFQHDGEALPERAALWHHAAGRKCDLIDGSTVRRKNRIAYVCSRYPALREVFIIREVLALERAGVEVCVYSLKRPERLDHGILKETKAVPYYSRHLLSWSLIADNVVTFLKSPVKYLRFPISQAWAVRRYPLQAFKNLALFPKMVHYARHMKRRGIMGVNSCWANFPTTLALVGKSFFGTPYSMTCRAWDIYVPMNQIGLVEKVANSSVVRTNNDAGARFMKSFCLEKEDESKISRVYNPFDVENTTPREEAPAGRFLITSGGSLVEQKGLTYLLDAVAILKQKEIPCDVKIVGDGAMRQSLEDQIVRLGIGDCVEMIGAVSNQDFLDRMRRSSAFVLPSVPASDGHLDGIPNVLIESASLGVPVISTEVSGIPELVENGVNGLLVPPRDSQALAAAIQRLMADPEMQRDFACNGRSKVRELFDMSANARALIEIYRAADLF